MGNRRSFPPGTPAWVDLETAAGTTDASRFYCGLFGWTVVALHRPLDDYAGYWTFVQNGGDIGGLAPGDQPVWTMYVSVADIDLVTDLVVDHGGSVVAGPMQVFDAGRLAVYLDPAGVRFAAWEPQLHTGVDVVDVPNSFTWAELACRDVETAKAFYRNVLGWQTTTRPPVQGATTTELTRHDGQTVAGMVQLNERWPAGIPAQWMIYFAVADTDVIAARATQLGGNVRVPPFDIPGTGRAAVLNDPEGGYFAILQRT